MVLLIENTVTYLSLKFQRWDTSEADYKKLPNDGSAWEFNTGTYRVIRGGSWNDSPRFLRSANRFRITPGDRDYYLGFRLARSKDK